METKLQRPPPREVFFAPLAVSLGPTDLEMVQFAYECSKYGHAMQKRANGDRYFDHPKMVAWIYINEFKGRDVRVICDMLLHDLVEDAFLLSSHRLAHNFGAEVALDVAGLTKLPKAKDGSPKESTEEYLDRIIVRGPEAILTKLVDRLHNMRTVEHRPLEKRHEQIEETERYHLKILLPALGAHGSEWEELAIAVERKLQEALKAVPLR